MSMPQAWRLAARTAALWPSAVRDILMVTQLSRVLSLAGGLPSPDSFPIEALAEASFDAYKSAYESAAANLAVGQAAILQAKARALLKRAANA